MGIGADFLKKLGKPGGFLGGQQTKNVPVGSRRNPLFKYDDVTVTKTHRPDMPQADPYMMPEKVAAMRKRWEAGEFETETEVDMLSRSLDEDFLASAAASIDPEQDLPAPPRAPSGSQPGPGDFTTLFSMGDPLKRKRKTLEEIGRTA